MHASVDSWAVELRDVEFRYARGEFILRLEQWKVEASSHVAVIGPSGSGKTTLLHLLAGIYTPHRGDVQVGPFGVHELGDDARRRFRIRHIGFVFQDFELLEYLSVHENIILPFLINPILRLERGTWDRAAELARHVGLGDKLRRNVTQLSQGERQRVGICRALITEPHVILADEPTGNLDPDGKHRIVELLHEHARARRATLVMVTHDRQLLSRMDDVVRFDELARRGVAAREAD